MTTIIAIPEGEYRQVVNRPITPNTKQVIHTYPIEDFPDYYDRLPFQPETLDIMDVIYWQYAGRKYMSQCLRG